MKNVLDIIIARLKEPSTWAGLGAIFLAFTGWSQELWSALSTAGMSIAGVVAVILAEKKSQQ